MVSGLPYDQERAQLMRRMRMAQLLGSQQPTNSPLVEVIRGIGNVIAGTRGRKAEERISELDATQRQADMAAIKSGDWQAVRDPRLQQLAVTLAGQDQSRQMEILKLQLEQQRRAEDLARDDANRRDTQQFQERMAEGARGNQAAIAQMTQAAANTRLADSQNFQLQMEQWRKQNNPNLAQQEAIKKDADRIVALNESEAGRLAAIRNAEAFLSKFDPSVKADTKGTAIDGIDVDVANSGAGRSFASYLPTFTSQGQFDEALDAFAEDAARARLSARGETRPTDSDVEGQKRALFGVGKDEKVNANLLRNFIEEQKAAQVELEKLRKKNSGGSAATAQEMSDDDLLKALQ